MTFDKLFSDQPPGRNFWPILKVIGKLFFLLSLILAGISFFKKKELPNPAEISSELYLSPVQSALKAPSFEKERRGIIYTLTPRAGYRLNGLVVSAHRSSAWWDFYHDRWKDFINTRDLCVVWGENLRSGIYREVKFTHGSWTCYADWKNPEAASKFREDELSNNHLIPQDSDLEQIISRVEPGDQITLEGLLVEYSHSRGSFRRGTSLSRSDRGNGACETVYVQKFQILKKASSPWAKIFSAAKAGMLVSFLLWLIAFLKIPF